jgi:cellulose synthase/poly-beta-1,6-N-acetylglucosamine synthase-like glycosyltransferase
MSAAPAASSPSITVVVTVLDDPRLERALESLRNQRTPPREILVDDGGRGTIVREITNRWSEKDPRVRYLLAPGNVAESRNQAWASAQGDLVAFLDADEVAPPEWLERLAAPFEDPSVGFAAGPTPAIASTLRNRTAQFYHGYLQRFYDRVASVRPASMPMGNSMWRRRLRDEVGPLETFGGQRVGNEDQEFALRVLSAGYRGVYQPDAAVGHDFSDITLRSLWNKQRRYAEGGYRVWRSTGVTYEVRAVTLVPYTLFPLLILVGALALLDPAIVLVASGLIAAGALGLVAVAVALTISGRRQEPRYPGLRFQALEIVRRWANLYGALRGALVRNRRGRSAAAPVSSEKP